MSIRQNFPTTPPSLVLDFANSKTLDPRITFSRTTTATRMNELGLIESVDADIARFDHEYDASTGVIKSLGLLVEEQRINYVYDSTDPTWNSIRGGWTSPTDIISPDGTTNYVGLYTEDGQTGSHHLKIPANTPPSQYAIADNTIVTGTAWVKNNGKDVITFGFNDKSDDYPRGYFNFNTEDVYGVTTNYSLSVIKYPNDWYRFIFTGNGGSGTSRNGPVLSIFMVQNGTTGITGYTGDNTSGVYVWGPQVEIGSFPTSYIPTSGSTATRNPDIVTMTGDNFSDWYNQSEGTIYCSCKINSTSNIRVFNIDDGTNTNRISGLGGGTFYQTFINPANAGPTASFPTNYNLKIASGHQDNNIQVYVNSSYQNSNTSITIPKNLNTFRIGNWQSGNLQGSTISKLTYYPTRLSNDNLQNLTK